jgi:hypothetical protein
MPSDPQARLGSRLLLSVVLAERASASRNGNPAQTVRTWEQLLDGQRTARLRPRPEVSTKLLVRPGAKRMLISSLAVSLSFSLVPVPLQDSRRPALVLCDQARIKDCTVRHRQF